LTSVATGFPAPAGAASSTLVIVSIGPSGSRRFWLIVVTSVVPTFSVTGRSAALATCTEPAILRAVSLM